MKVVKQIVFGLIIIISTLNLNAQLSSTHYLPPLKQAPVAGMQGQLIFLSTPETTPFDVNVYQGTSTTPITTISISNTAAGVYTPSGGVTASNGVFTNGANNSTIITPDNAGIVVSVAGLRFDAPSGKQFYVNWRAAEMNQGSSLVSLGKSALGTNFKWGGLPQIGAPRSNTVIGIMATEDNTVVKISGYDPNCTFSKYVNGVLNPAAITDDSLTITLNAFQTYTLESYATATNSPNLSGWLGASISSNKNIAVNQGHLYLSLGNADYSMTQLAPITKIGNSYLLIRGNGPDLAEFPIVIATKDNTSIYINNEALPFATLNNGQWIKVPSTKFSKSSITPGYNSGGFAGANMFIKANENVYVFQAICASNTDATVDMFQVAPLNCFLDKGVNNIPYITKTGVPNINLSSVGITLTASSAITTNNIIIKYGAGSTSTVATSTLNAVKSSVPGTTDWVSYYIPNLSGDISVSTNGPVAVGYLGVSGVVGVGGYFSGFGTIPSISTINQNVCLNTSIAPLTSSVVNANFTYQWYKTNTALNTGGTIITGATASTYTPSSSTIGTSYYYVVLTNELGCTITSNVSGAITVNGNTISLTSSANTRAQTLCKNNPIANITYATTGATGATVTGLPSGITGTWTNSVLTISGTPTVAGNYIYTVSTIGGCSTITATGTITVTNNNVTITSSAGGSNICPGTLVTFTASVCNITASATYQWFKNGTAISGATSATYTTTSLSNGDQVYVQYGISYSSSISQSNLILNLDAGNPASYSGAGTVWNDISSSQNNMNFYTDVSYSTFSDPGFDTNEGGSMQLNNVFGKTINNTGISGSGPRTFSAWVKLNDLGPNPTRNIALLGTYNYHGSSFEMMNYGSPNILLHYTDYWTNLGNASLNPNQWYYLTMSNDGSTSKIYINGNLDASFGSTVLSTENTPLYIGTFLWGSLQGKIASIDLYNIALSDQVVKNNYDATKNRFTNSNSNTFVSSNSITTNVVGSSTFSLTSSNGSNAQTVCVNNSIAAITYTTSGAVSATVTGLPSGVTGSFSNNLVTINGTPTSAGNYTFTVNLVASGCAGSSSFTGTITVLGSGSFPVYTVSVSGEPCVGQAVLTVTSGFVSYTWLKENTIINGATSNTYTPTSIGLYKVTVSNGICATTSSSTTIYDYALTPEGKMMATNSGQLVSLEGAINNGTGLQEVGKIINIPNTRDGLTAANASSSAYQIKLDYPNSPDGFYWIKNANINGGVPFKIYADMTTTDGVMVGGWTLILKNSSNVNWTYSNAIATNTTIPFANNADVVSTTTPNYSIIGWADYIKKSASGFQYMIDATNRESFGGIWTANGNYSFVNTGITQTNITLNRKFGDWNYMPDTGITQKMPSYSNTIGSGQAIITTTSAGVGGWWGTLVTSNVAFHPTPWIGDAGGGTANPNPGIIWYWVR